LRMLQRLAVRRAFCVSGRIQGRRARRSLTAIMAALAFPTSCLSEGAKVRLCRLSNDRAGAPTRGLIGNAVRGLAPKSVAVPATVSG
jgi:hypothetical protein